MADRNKVVTVGSGPNGLAAAITLARAGRSVQVIEASDTLGGGCRSAALTQPGFIHDTCSAIHPLAVASPFFREMPLAEHGVEWVYPPAAFAHPLDDGTAVVVERDLAATAANLGPDGAAYQRLIGPYVHDFTPLTDETLGPLRIPPRHPFALARFGALALLPAAILAKIAFRGKRARAMFAGVAAHSMLPLEAPVSAAYALVLATSAHAVGWPMPRGGSQRIADALVEILRGLGGEVETGRRVTSLDEFSDARAILLDVGPRQLASMAGERLSESYRRRLGQFRYGPGVFKIDFALSGPIPWKAKECARAATLHLGGTLEEIATSERAASGGRHSDRPFVLLVQPSLFDPSRAPAGKHTAWAYCHLPNGSTKDMTAVIEAQIERFAPGFRDCVIARHTRGAVEMEAYNPNYVGGDIMGGAQDIWQTFTRPMFSLRPYTTPLKGVYLCSSSTPPGGGVHGMCGYHAAKVALREMGG
ncbi:MAG: NAD(P)/FAD-dependent oxidoreductase [Thermoflexales bacterium]